MAVDDYSDLYQQAGLKYGIDPALLMAQGDVESSGNPDAVGPDTKYGKAKGIAQFIPATAKSLGIDPTDPAQAIDGQARLMAENLNRYGDVQSAVSAYHGGTNTDNWGPKTKDYTQKVLGKYQQMTSNSDDPFAQAKAELATQQKSSTDNSDPFEAAKAELAAKPNDDKSTVEDDKDYGTRTWNDVTSNLNQGAKILVDPNIDPLSSALQVSSKALNAVYSPGGEAVKSGYNSLPDSITQPINKLASNAVNAVSGAYDTSVNKLSNTAVGQSIGNYLMDSPRIQSGMQIISDDAKAAANLLTLNPVQGTLTKAGEPIYKSGQAAEDLANNNAIQKMVLPKETPKVAADNALRTTEVNGSKVYNPTSYEQKMAEAVSNVDGVKPSNTYQKNLNLIQNADKAEATSLKSNLDDLGNKYNLTYKPDYLNSKLDVSANQIASDAKLYGNDRASALEPFQVAKEIAAQNEQTPSGLLKARQDFDNWASKYAPRVFDNATGIDNAKQAAVKAARNTMNDTISEIAPYEGVKESLTKQNLLKSAVENIAPKAAAQAPTKIGRAIQTVLPSNLKTTLLGVEGAQAADMLTQAHPLIRAAATPLIVGGGALYGANKLIRAPMTRKIIGNALGNGQ